MRFKDSLAERWQPLKEWARDGRPLWWWIASAALVIGVCYLAPIERLGVGALAADRVRWAGMFLQFAGLYTVAVGLRESRRLFNRPLLLVVAWEWLRRLVSILFQRQPVSGDVTIVVPAGHLTFSMGSPTVVVSGATIEERVAELERKHAGLDASVAALGQNLNAIQNQTKGDLERERQARASEDRKIVAQLETAVIGGIHLELSGLAFLVIGITMATVPVEIAVGLQVLGL